MTHDEAAPRTTSVLPLENPARAEWSVRAAPARVSCRILPAETVTWHHPRNLPYVSATQRSIAPPPILFPLARMPDAPYFWLASRMFFLFCWMRSSSSSRFEYAVWSSDVSWWRSFARPLVWPIVWRVSGSQAFGPRAHLVIKVVSREARLDRLRLARLGGAHLGHAVRRADVDDVRAPVVELCPFAPQAALLTRTPLLGRRVRPRPLCRKPRIHRLVVRRPTPRRQLVVPRVWVGGGRVRGLELGDRRRRGHSRRLESRLCDRELGLRGCCLACGVSV